MKLTEETRAKSLKRKLFKLEYALHLIRLDNKPLGASLQDAFIVAIAKTKKEIRLLTTCQNEL